jgi:hypothetical protein
MGTPSPRSANEGRLQSFAAERSRPCPCYEIESLQVVAPLLFDGLTSDELTKKKESSAVKTLDRGPGSEATGTDGLFSSIAVSRPSFWKALKREK